MPRSPLNAGQRGFTLIELIVVLAIAAGIGVTILGAARSLNLFPTRGEVMKLSGAIRNAYERSALTGMRYDIILNIGANQLTLQCSSDLSAARRQTQETASQRAFRNRNTDPFAAGSDSAQQAEDAIENASAGMSACDDTVVRGFTMERGLTIERVQTARTKDPVDEGQVPIAVFPNGTIEPAVIWIAAGEQKWTLFIHEMTGRVEVVSGEERRVTDFFEVEEER